MINDVVELVKELKDISEFDPGNEKAINNIVKTLSGGNSRKSITRRAKNNICQFPVIISSSVEKASITMIVKALEREYSTLIRFVIGQEDVIDLDKFDKNSYLRKIHQNSSINPSAEYVQAINSVFAENVVLLNKEQLKPFLEDFEMGAINNLTISNYKVVSEARTVKRDAKLDAFGQPVTSDGVHSTVSTTETYKDDNEQAIDKINVTNKQADTKLKIRQAEKIDAEFAKDYKTGITSQLVDLDVKKSNELMPTVLEIVVDYRANDTFKTTTMLIGIKAVAHVLPTNEMTYFIGKSLKENRFIFRLIQWSTGEIKFWKDFVLSIDRIKAEASSSKSSRWWAFLKSRAKHSRFKNLLGKEGFIPNATFVLSMAEVEFLKNSEGIDLFDYKITDKLMKIFFLLRFVVLDDIDEIAYMYDEEQQTFNHYSYNQLEKEKSSSNKDLKSLVSLINR